MGINANWAQQIMEWRREGLQGDQQLAAVGTLGMYPKRELKRGF